VASQFKKNNVELGLHN